MINARIALLTTFAAAFVLASVSATAAPHAAKVIYAFGQVKALDGKGTSRKLSRGDVVGAGDTVSTTRGRAQIKFTDGGFASLQPNTDYHIDEYKYEGKADGNERSFLNLLKGSVRLVTGAIGRSNRKNFRIKTSVATIGIRGTHGVITECVSGSCGAGKDGTKVKGTGGEWLVTLGANTWGVGPGDNLSCANTCTYEFQADPDRVEVDTPDLLLGGSGDDQDQTGDPCSVVACGGDDFFVVQNLIGGGADMSGFDADTDSVDGLSIVTLNGEPIAAIVVGGADFDDGDIGILTNDLDGLSQALSSFPDSEVVGIGNSIIAAIAPEVAQGLAMHPAVVSPDDFHTSADGIVTMGRFVSPDPSDLSVDGRLLDIEVFLDEQEIFIDLISLNGFEAEHFWYAEDPGPLTTTLEGWFPITDTTFSTALDGSGVGAGVAAFNPAAPADGGWLYVQINPQFPEFGFGWVDMTVNHGNMEIDVDGSIEFEDDPRFFVDSFITGVVNGVGSYTVQLDGAFAGQPTNGIPPRVGAAYVINSMPAIGGVFSGGPFNAGDPPPPGVPQEPL